MFFQIHLHEEKIGVSRNLRIHCLKLFRLLYCLGLDGHRLHLATACHPAMQSFTTGSHQRRVCFWCGGGDEFEIGGGTPPRPPKICIYMYLLVYTYFIHRYEQTLMKQTR